VFIVPEGGSFQDKREALPLQAADLLAYETMRAELKKPVKAWEEYRMSARKLLEAPLERIEGTVEATFLARMIVEYNEKHGTNV
jgi:hypothetical protein